MRHVAANLRHELHKVLQYIVTQAEEIDERISVRHVDLTRPASRIVGATVILDHFIEMISGVYDFSPDQAQGAHRAASSISLHDTVRRYIYTYSLIRNTRRASDLNFAWNIQEDVHISILPSVVEYLIAVLCDNIWKYAIEGSLVQAECIDASQGLISLRFKNIGAELPGDGEIFSKGYQRDSSSEGFGFGLYWATLLIDHYNRSIGRVEDPLTLEHAQLRRVDGFAEHIFTIKNIAMELRK